MQNKKYISFLIASLMVMSFLVVEPAFAQGGPGLGRGMMGRGERSPGVFGTVSAINGNTITVTAKNRPAPNRNGSNPNSNATITYTVDASGATVTKNGATSTVSAITVGDNIIVQGTVTGTNIVAKTIRDGIAQPQFQGNGQPVVAGKVTAISGNTITITNISNVTYTVDATNAKILVKNQLSSISSIAQGDNLVVQGTINGTSVVASSVIDQKPNVNNNGQDNPKPRGFMGGMMGGIGNFFKHLFGF